MPAPFATLSTVLGSALTTAGTLTLGYPAGYTRGDFISGVKHELVWNGKVFRFGRDITIVFGATTFVITMAATATIPAGAQVFIGLDCGATGDSGFAYVLNDLSSASALLSQTAMFAPSLLVSLGSPTAISATGIRTAVTFSAPGTTAATALALVNDGVAATIAAALVTPRNITVTAAGVLTNYIFRITGTDCSGRAQIEDITGVNANTVQGKKAFASVTSTAVYGTGTPGAVSIGWGKILGLPFYLLSSKLVLSEMESLATLGGGAGTFVAGVTTTPTAATGDVRGTYTPTATLDGSIPFHLLIAQATNTFGVPPFGDLS